MTDTTNCNSSDIHSFRLPNAKQNQLFEVNLSEILSSELLEEQSLQLLDNGGTNLELKGHILSGKPKISGDCLLILQGTFQDETSQDNETNIKIELSLLVNPDPKTLWNNIEPESNLFYKTHQDFQRYVNDDESICLTAARVRGRSHAHKGSFCEDDIAILHSKNLGYLGMVCDGAGSSRFSRLASQVLTESIPRHLQKIVAEEFSKGDYKGDYKESYQGHQNELLGEILGEMPGEILGKAVCKGFSALMEYVDLGDVFKVNDLYATCLIFWALPLENQRWALTSFWVGDGGLAVAHDNTVTLLGTPDSGEFSGQTRFLSEEELSPEAQKNRIQSGIYNNLQSVWAMTDGITDAKFASEKDLQNTEEWQKLIAEMLPILANEKSCCEWLNFWSQGNHDDRAFAALTIHNHHGEGI